jgi:hypothetical protein
MRQKKDNATMAMNRRAGEFGVGSTASTEVHVRT